MDTPVRVLLRDGEGLQMTSEHLVDPGDARDPEADDEQIRRGGEDLARLPDAQEVPVRDQPHEHERRQDPQGHRERDDRADRLDAGRRGHAHGQDVVDEERDTGELCGQEPEVVLRDDVGTARGRVRLDRLSVAEDQDRLDEHDRERDAKDVGEREDADRRDQDTQDLLGRVRDRGHVVRGEDRERGRSAETLVLEP